MKSYILGKRYEKFRRKKSFFMRCCTSKAEANLYFLKTGIGHSFLKMSLNIFFLVFTLAIHSIASSDLSINVPTSGYLPERNTEEMYRVIPGRDHILIILLQKESAWDSQLDIRYGEEPTDSNSDKKDGGSNDNSDQALSILPTLNGSYYVRVKATYGDHGGHYIITAHTEMTIPTIQPGGSVSITLPHQASERIYQVFLDSPHHVIGLLQKQTAWESRFDIRYLAIPSDSNYDDTDGGNDDKSDQVVDRPNAAMGPYYLRISAKDAGGNCILQAHTEQTIPELVLGAEEFGTLPHRYSERYYMIRPGSKQHLMIFLEKNEAWDSQLCLQYRNLPAGSEGDSFDGGNNDYSDQAVECFTTQAGEYFTRISATYNDEGGDFIITAQTQSSMPNLDLGINITGVLPHQGSERFYQVFPDAAQHLMVLLEKAATFDSTLLMNFEALPTDGRYIDSDEGDSSSDQAVQTKWVDGGYYYIRLKATSSPQDGSFSLVAHSPDTMPYLSRNSIFNGNLPHRYSERYFVIHAGDEEYIRVDFEKTWDSQILIRDGRLPTDQDYSDSDGGRSQNDNQRVEIDSSRSTDCFVRIRAEYGDSGGPYQLISHCHWSPSMAETTYIYNGYGWLIRASYPSGKTAEFDYDVRGNMTSYRESIITPTPLPSDSVDLGLKMPGTTFPENTVANLILDIKNNSGRELSTDLYLLLEVYGDYWFYPSWVFIDQGMDHRNFTFDGAFQGQLMIIPSFVMPDCPYAGPFHFYAILFAAGYIDVDHILSNLASYEFWIGG